MEFSISAVLIVILVFFLFIFWAMRFCRRYLIVMMLGFSCRLGFILIQEQTRIFGNGDINDFFPCYLRFEVAIQKSDVFGFIEPHAAFYTALYAG